MTSTTDYTTDRVADMKPTEAVEIRFTAIRSHARWQLLASVTKAGTIDYTLHTNPHGSYSHSFPSSLYNDTRTVFSIPMKAYNGWQTELVEWITSICSHDGTRIYQITNIL